MYIYIIYYIYIQKDRQIDKYMLLCVLLYMKCAYTVIYIYKCIFTYIYYSLCLIIYIINNII